MVINKKTEDKIFDFFVNFLYQKIGKSLDVKRHPGYDDKEDSYLFVIPPTSPYYSSVKSDLIFVIQPLKLYYPDCKLWIREEIFEYIYSMFGYSLLHFFNKFFSEYMKLNVLSVGEIKSQKE
jgi:hypothetical protein